MKIAAVRREDPALADMRYYLRAWRRWVRAWSAPLGYPSQAPFVRAMKPVVAWDGSDAEIEVDQWILRAVDTEIEGLEPRKRAAVRLVYLNEILPAVFRSLRITEQEARKIVDLAEVEMIPRLRVRGVVLGGY